MAAASDDTLTALLIPPAAKQLGPRVEHLMVEEEAMLSAYLCKRLQLPEVRLPGCAGRAAAAGQRPAA
jgi:hypothetical protein